MIFGGQILGQRKISIVIVDLKVKEYALHTMHTMQGSDWWVAAAAVSSRLVWTMRKLGREGKTNRQ